jgi:hypothetical protein
MVVSSNFASQNSKTLDSFHNSGKYLQSGIENYGNRRKIIELL